MIEAVINPINVASTAFVGGGVFEYKAVGDKVPGRRWRWVVADYYVHRAADIIGARWVEPEAIAAERADIAARRLRKALYNGGKIDVPEGVFFPLKDGIKVIPIVAPLPLGEQFVALLGAWRDWRLGRSSRPSPEGWYSTMYHLARWISRSYAPGVRLTRREGEAFSRFRDARLTIKADGTEEIRTPRLRLVRKAERDYWEVHSAS